MAFGLFGFGEKTGGLDHNIHAKRFPRQVRGILCADHVDVLAVHHQHVILEFVSGGFLRGHLALETVLGGIVLEQIGEIVRGHDVANCDHMHIFADQALLADRAINQTADAAETINCDFRCHNF